MVTMMRCVAVPELPVKAVGDHVFAGGVARPLHVGGVRTAAPARPAFPSSPSRARSIMPPWIGVGSILKSPVNTTVPTGVRMAKATASAMEWFTWMNSTVKHPAFTTSPALWVTSLTLSARPVLLQLQLDQTGGHGGCRGSGQLTLPHGVGDGTDVVLVAVGDEHAPQLFLVVATR